MYIYTYTLLCMLCTENVYQIPFFSTESLEQCRCKLLLYTCPGARNHSQGPMHLAM